MIRICFGRRFGDLGQYVVEGCAELREVDIIGAVAANVAIDRLDNHQLRRRHILKRRRRLRPEARSRGASLSNVLHMALGLRPQFHHPLVDAVEAVGRACRPRVLQCRLPKLVRIRVLSRQS